MTLYGGVDLHSNNNYIGVVDQANEVLFQKRLPNDLEKVLAVLEPFKNDVQAVAVESTFNWYWFVDGLMENGYTVRLANPSAIQQYEGLKNIDDKRSALQAREPPEARDPPRRQHLPEGNEAAKGISSGKGSTWCDTGLLTSLSVKNIISRSLGMKMRSEDVKKLDERHVRMLFPEERLFHAVNASVRIIRTLSEEIEEIEAVVVREARLRKEFEGLLSLPGIGRILALTIMFEVGDIRRFPKVGDYSSYCRCVASTRSSNGKKKGEGNRKNGNKYLSWAYVEATHAAKRFYPIIHGYHQKKMSQTNKAVAVKAISNKLARASYYIMRDQAVYDEKKLFGGRAEPDIQCGS